MYGFKNGEEVGKTSFQAARASELDNIYSGYLVDAPWNLYVVVALAKPTMEGKDRSLISIVARAGLLAFVTVFVVLIPAVSSAVTLPEANNTAFAVEYYCMARRIFFASLAISGVNIVYTLIFVNRKSLPRERKHP